MFQLTNHEVTNLKSQSVISCSKASHGGRRARPYAFTVQGVAMLSSGLRSETAVQVNSHDLVIGELAEAIRQLAAAPHGKRSRPIGFTADLEAGLE